MPSSPASSLRCPCRVLYCSIALSRRRSSLRVYRRIGHHVSEISPAKATTYRSLVYLKRLSESQINLLDFSDFVEKWGVEELNALFP